MMLDELQRRNYAATTTEYYLRTLERFARYFRRPPDQLTPHHIRTYQTYLQRERKLHPHSVRRTVMHSVMRLVIGGESRANRNRPPRLPVAAERMGSEKSRRA